MSYEIIKTNKSLSELNKMDDGFEYEEISLEDYINSLETTEEKIAAYKEHGMAINIHFMISSRTIDDAYTVFEAMKGDERLQYMNAIVMLGLKQKGRGVKYDTVSRKEYKDLVDYCLSNNIPFGFDSCSAPAFIDAVEGHENFDMFKMMAEDCESTLFSSYVDSYGNFYPCSFTENWKEGGWEEGINVLEAQDFIKDVWNHPRTVKFRNDLIRNTDCNGCRNCPAYVVCENDMRLHTQKEIEIVEVK